MAYLVITTQRAAYIIIKLRYVTIINVRQKPAR